MKRQRSVDQDQPFVGTFRLGTSNVDVYGMTGQTGGCFDCAPNDKSLPRIKIGFGYENWWEVVAVLCHECIEYLAAQKDCRFEPCGGGAVGSDCYRFFFNHDSFSRIAEDQAYFLVQCLPELAKVWKKHKPKT